MPAIVNPTEEVGAIVLTLAASAIGLKRASGTVDPFVTWDPVQGDVTIAAPVGTTGGGGTRKILFPGDVVISGTLTAVVTLGTIPSLSVAGASILGAGAWPTATIGQTDSRVGMFSATESGRLLLGDMQAGVAASRGGELWLGARATTATLDFAHVVIRGERENATSGNFATRLLFQTSNAAGTLATALTIASTGVVTLAFALAVPATITSTADGNLFARAGASTVAQWLDIANTGGRALIGVGASAGGVLLPGSDPYATLITTVGATPIQFGVNQVLKVSVTATGMRVVLPTTTAGLVAGDLWRNGTVVNII